MCDFKKKIQDGLKQQGLSVSKLSRLADCHQDTLYKYLNGKSEIRSDILEKILKALK